MKKGCYLFAKSILAKLPIQDLQCVDDPLRVAKAADAAHSCLKSLPIFSQF
jgi:hypothetical protein